MTRRRRTKLSPKRQLARDKSREQECIANVLVWGVSELLKHGYSEKIELDTAIAQIEEARIHFNEADRYSELAWHPRLAKKGKK